MKSQEVRKGVACRGVHGYNGTVGLYAGGRVARGEYIWLSPERLDGCLAGLDDADAGVCTQTWNLHYMHPQRPVHREGRTQQGAGCLFSADEVCS